jgi:hypothetical protein
MDAMTLEERLVALEEKVATLEHALAEKQHPSMKRHKRCQCGSGSLLHVAHIDARSWLALQSGILLQYGVLELYVCRVCSLVEWHVQELEKVRVEPPISEYATEKLDADPDTGPYR